MIGIELLSYPATCRSPYGERGLKCNHFGEPLHHCCRSPYGERGLKYLAKRRYHGGRASLSLRRAWIEMIRQTPPTVQTNSRSPYGERGLKFHDGEALVRDLEVALLTESVD